MGAGRGLWCGAATNAIAKGVDREDCVVIRWEATTQIQTIPELRKLDDAVMQEIGLHARRAELYTRPGIFRLSGSKTHAIKWNLFNEGARRVFVSRVSRKN